MVLLLAACGSSDEDSTGATFSDVASSIGGDASDDRELSMEDEVSPAGLDRKADDGLGNGGGIDAPEVEDGSLQPIDTGRDIVFTATVSVEVENLAAASQLALTRIEAMGGLLYGQTTSTQGTPYTVLTFKVAPQDFQAALRALGDVGEIREQNISTTDVTERIVDLESQIITSEASVERLRTFLSNATELNQIAQLERELLDRETVLERLRGQLRTVQGQVALATITVSMTELVPGPAVAISETAYLGHDGGSTCGGDPELSIDEAEPFTVCLEVTNVGDTHLASIEIREEALKLKTRDFTVAQGSLDGVLAPGASLVLFYEATAQERVAGQAQVTARPVDAVGDPVGQGTVASRSSVAIDVIADDSLPGFASGFESGWATLAAVIAALVLSFGFLLPLIPLIAIAWFALRMLRRWAAARPAKPSAPVPPPPAPVRQPAAASAGPEG